MKNISKYIVALSVLLLLTGQVNADNAAEMARKLQDPLANIAAVMTDNDVLFRTGKDDEEVSYSFQLQPVKAWSFDEQGFNFIARGVVPVLGVASTATIPPAVDQPNTNADLVWGISDIVTQFFFSPKTDQAWKWGAGPMISWKTRSKDDLAGAGWGAGPVGVLVGNLSENVSSAFIVGHMWGDSGNFSTTTVQPMIFYNIPSMPGVSVNYNATTSYNWEAKTSNDRLTLPLGLGMNKAFDLGDGYGLEMGIGLYTNVVRPDGAANWKINWALNFLMP